MLRPISAILALALTAATAAQQPPARPAGRDDPAWAWRPVERPTPPPVRDPRWPRSPIDRFVLAKLEARGLTPAPQADRRTLVRRVSFDLIGLPPSPKDVEAFVADRAPEAYERLVDRLLASPHYGERQARHWLDVARFGESNGFERDEPREHAWRYRDWLIRASNDDLPYDEFVRLQIAGDVVSDAPGAAVATGFLVAGAYDSVGQGQQSAAMKAVVRQDELEDVVGTVSQAFLGLTVHCARCHDHKFDPISQSDYYRMAAALAGVRHGERDVTPAGAIERHEAVVAEARAKIAELSERIAAIDAPARHRILAARGSAADAASSPAPSWRWDFARQLDDLAGELASDVHGGAVRSARGLAVGAAGEGEGAYVASAPLPRGLRAKTLEAWLILDDLEQRGGGVVGVQTLDGRVFDAIVFGEREPGRWMAGSDHFRRTRSFGGPREISARDRPVHVAITYAEDGTITGYRDGQPYGAPYHSEGPIEFRAGAAQVVFGVRHVPPVGNRLLSGTILGARVYDRALTAAEVAATAESRGEWIGDAELEAQLSPADLERRRSLAAELATWRTRLAPLEPVEAYANVPREPEPTHRLERGDPKAPAEVVAPGAIASLGGADFGLPADAPEAGRRLELAAWIVDARNPLFARVAANRAWHELFGIGLVDTPSDFGRNGGRPSHPKLLDWLATELARVGYSRKRLHRAIVLSATYRQSSRISPEAERIDAEGRLLWRMRPRRLDAESLRDAMLSVAGRLDPRALGRGYRDFEIVQRKGTFYYDPIEPPDGARERRSVYRMWARGGRSRMLDAFDCPDPSTTTPRRAVTTTPLQALTLLNSAFALRMSDALAARLEGECDGTDARIVRAYALAYGRAPDAGELLQARVAIERHGLSTFARAIFNSSEFSYLD